MKHVLATSLVLLLTAACAQNQTAEDSVDQLEATAEAAVTSIGGLPDEQSGSGFALQRTEPALFKQNAIGLLLPRAHAAAFCGRAAGQACLSGSREIEYSGCSVGASGFAVTGEVALNYSAANCSLDALGNSVSRTYDFTVSGPRGGSVQHSSASRVSQVDGSAIGGGGRLTKSAGGWDVEVLGKHSIGTGRRGRQLFDISLRTTSPIGITGGLDRASRIVNGGAIEVHHNLAGFKAVFTPNDLRYSAMCCHPVSGRIDATYSGSVNGSGTLTFDGCGSATLTKDGVSKTVSLTYCE